MIIEGLTVLVGVIIIIGLAQLIIRNSVELAKHYGVSGSFVGLTVLSIGTSIPEIMTHIVGSIAILKDPSVMGTLSSLLIGTNVGSDIFQEAFILPLVGIVGTIVVVRKNLIAEMGGMIAAALLVWVLSLGGVLTRIEGAVFLLAYVAYLVYLKKSNINEKIKAKNHLRNRQVALAIGLVLMSFIIMAIVTNRVVSASTSLIEVLPISASLFGVLILGIASGLPELTTSLVAILRGQKGISAGILIGSNITNPLFGIGLGALISSYVVPKVVVLYDLPFKIGIACLIFFFLWRREDLTKWEGFLLIGLFIGYLTFRIMLFPVDF